MWSIRSKKYFAVTRLKGRGLLRNQRGQGILEYVLVLAVVIGIFLIASRSFMPSFKKKIGELSKGGIFKEDSTGAAFYYYPVR